ncbi:class I SAM-dependent methyltransferase [Desulfobotulus sp.]|jgi:2-polyprenyl-3-methyl-5-hydroxy-6-metoxy-1,4-benzoquinol methylase|uniref:class I SAM-dependent methyltransferase n=1 Tax=Desulfobotulus sp. TaxID=1940337 RepID=UPI002A36A669|nr:methyltransferase domain-containing protein [Desulfobotulus sp.]MDY0162830.1 methyltransferase domain-containing protein [Desulfobotulus sp.]
MASVSEHYANHLGSIYTWMAGGVESAFNRGAAETESFDPLFLNKSLAVDLGAGFGMHTIPLARRGFSVVAIDTCTELLEELRQHADTLPIQTIPDDFLAFRRYVSTEAQIVLCMGDTLTHLPDTDSVLQLLADVAESLIIGGQFILTFRDYSQALSGDQRFISVRSDGSRILTCFLEYAEAHVTVHDILHELDASGWCLRVSSYQKLRLAPDWVCAALESRGFSVRREPGMAGMVRLVSTRVK